MHKSICSFTGKLRIYCREPLSLFLRIVVTLAMLITLLLLIFIIAYILINGIPYLKPSLFSLKYNSENVSMLPSIINTVIMAALSLSVTGPVGIFAAIYLAEYASRGNRLVSLIRITAGTLSGIPSIVYGIFGMLFFVTSLKLGYSLLSGALTLSIMILPLIMQTTEEALHSVPDRYRESSLGLGAGRLRTVFKIVLPAAAPGILSGVILAVGRIAGETAALIFTAGTVAEIPDSLTDSGRTLSVHMYLLSKEALHTGEAYAAAVVCLTLVFLINTLSASIAKRVAGR